MKLLQILTALLLTGALALPALGSGKVLELGHEASLDMVRLPDSNSSELTLQRCATCKVLRLRASAETRYQVGQQRLSLADFKQYVATNPVSGLVVMQLKGTNQLSRVVASGPRLGR